MLSATLTSQRVITDDSDSTRILRWLPGTDACFQLTIKGAVSSCTSEQIDVHSYAFTCNRHSFEGVTNLVLNRVINPISESNTRPKTGAGL